MELSALRSNQDVIKPYRLKGMVARTRSLWPREPSWQCYVRLMECDEGRLLPMVESVEVI
jgi:hypothetical protein